MANNFEKVKGAILPVSILTISLVVVGLGVGGLFNQLYQGRFLPGSYIQGVDVSGLNPEKARVLVSQQLPPLPNQIEVRVDSVSIASSAAELDLHYNLDQVLSEAMEHGRQGTWTQKLAETVQMWFRPHQVPVQLTYDQAKAQAMISLLAKQIDDQSLTPSATLKTSGNLNTISIFAGKPGRQILIPQTAELLQQNLTAGQATTEALVASTSAVLTPEQILAATDRTKKIVGHQVQFTAGDVTLKLNDQQMISLLALPEGFNQEKVTEQVEKWAQLVTRPAQEPVLEYQPETLTVSKFVPPKNGLDLSQEDATEQLLTAITEAEQSQTKEPLPTFPISVTTTPPNTSLASLNKLGIDQEIGQGESEYDHSIPTRIHNVALAASRVNNLIIKPGEEFSFNKALGDVSKATGFQPAYVIKSGQTVLGDGGGVCQVSTTVFRAVLSAGLPVTKRKAHSYRVSYYELDSKPGIDATVYAGDVDLRFKNDTGHHILIHTETDSKNLYMKVELYGTSDGRTTQIVDHKTWDPRPAPPAVYIPDPSLAPGTKKQVDWSASGIKASFKNVVKDKDGNVLREETYYSNYIPWSAKYLVGP